jgi:dolichol-phosphate mannosyltransferase
MNKSVTVVIPALNEEEHILGSYNKTKNTLKELGLDYEILLVDDGSEDKTLQVMESISSNDPLVHIIHHSSPQGMGFAYKKGIRLSKKKHFLLIPGDDDFEQIQIKKILEPLGQKDIIIPFHISQNHRPLKRRLFSQLFTISLNILFNLNLKYYNGPVLHRTESLKELTIKSDKFTYQAEILIKLIKLKKFSYTHVGILTNERKPLNSKAVKLKNFIDVGYFYWMMFVEIYFRKDL